MKELVEFIVKSLVDNPDQVDVSEFDEGATIAVEMSMAQPDIGRIIGRGGRVINAIRALAQVAAARQGKQASVEIIED